MADCDSKTCNFPTTQFQIISEEVIKLVQRFEDMSKKFDKSLNDLENMWTSVHETKDRVTKLEATTQNNNELRLQYELNRSKLESLESKVALEITKIQANIDLINAQFKVQTQGWEKIGKWILGVSLAIIQAYFAYLLSRGTP